MAKIASCLKNIFQGCFCTLHFHIISVQYTDNKTKGNNVIGTLICANTAIN